MDLPYEDKLVVNAFLDDENGLTFNLSKTLNPVGNYSSDLDNKITDAQVFLIENFTTQYPLQHTNKGNYELIDSNFVPQEGKSYSVKVIHPNYPVVTSKTIVFPKKFDLDFINIDKLIKSCFWFYSNSTYISVLNGLSALKSKPLAFSITRT